MPEQRDPFMQRVPGHDRSTEAGELSYQEELRASFERSRVQAEAEARLMETPEGQAAAAARHAELQEKWANEPRTDGEAYFAALENALKGDPQE